MELRRTIIIVCALWALLPLASGNDPRRDIDNGPCHIGMGENLRVCHIYHEDDGRLVMELQDATLNAWFQFDGDGVVEAWFSREDIGNAKRAVLWRFDASEAQPSPGKGISMDPGFVAVRITGRLWKPSGVEDVVTAKPRE